MEARRSPYEALVAANGELMHRVAALETQLHQAWSAQALAMQEVQALHRENERLRAQAAEARAAPDAEALAAEIAAHEAEAARLRGRQAELVSAAARALGDVEETLARDQFQCSVCPSDRAQLKVIARVREELIMDNDPTFAYVAAALLELISLSPGPYQNGCPRTYLVKDTNGDSCYTGVNYCYSQSRTDLAAAVAEWDTFVQGVPMDTGKEWVQVGDKYLPVKDRLDRGVRAQAGQPNENSRQRVLYAVDHVIRSAERALRDVIVLRIARDAKPKDRRDFDSVAARVFGQERERDVKLLSQLYLSYSKVMDGSPWSFFSKAQLMALKKGGPRPRRDHSPSGHDSNPAMINSIESFMLANAQNPDCESTEASGVSQYAPNVDQPQYVEVPPPCMALGSNSDSLFCEMFGGISNGGWQQYTDHSTGYSDSSTAASSSYQAPNSAGWNPHFWPSPFPQFFPPAGGD